MGASEGWQKPLDKAQAWQAENIPFIQALENNNTYSIAVIRDFLIANPLLHGLLAISSSIEKKESQNTPLLLAIKKGDTQTACAIIHYYTADELQFTDHNGQNALHLAAYLKLNEVVEAILKRAETTNCLETLVEQQNS